MAAYLKGIGPRIPSQALKEKVFAGMFSLMIADGKLDDKEKTAAIAFAQVFDIPQQRAIELIQSVMNALMNAIKK